VYNACNCFFRYIIINGNDFLTRVFGLIQHVVCAIQWHHWTGRKFRLQCPNELSHQRDGYPILEVIFTPTSIWLRHIRFIYNSFDSMVTVAK
jgi:hypothetical protein